MSVKWICDICGKETLINPPTEPQWEEKEVETPVPYKTPEGKIVYELETVKQKVPKLIKRKQQNMLTGEMQEIDVQEMVDLSARSYIVRLSITHETMQRDFCRKCLDKEIMPLYKPLWDKLESIKGK